MECLIKRAFEQNSTSFVSSQLHHQFQEMSFTKMINIHQTLTVCGNPRFGANLQNGFKNGKMC